MALKFQFQFAGADFSRPSSPYRKWLRIALLTFLLILAGLGYWAYLYHLTHGRQPVRHHDTPAAAVNPVAPTAPKTVEPDDAKPASSPLLRKVADASLIAVGNYLIKAAKIAPTAPVATTVPSAPSAATTALVEAAPFVVASAPTVVRPYRVHTDQERLLMAGQTAFDNMMDMANKYPDAYGFNAEDALSEAKLGAPMSVYTIEESARSSYQSGQPIKPLLKPIRQWVFPVKMGDRICCMVEVKQTGREYIPGQGNKSLAMAWNKILQKWPTEDGYHPMLVVNPEIPGYYFTVPELPQQNMTDVVEMFYFHPGISPADVILASWR
jgi:hypothetical protein